MESTRISSLALFLALNLLFFSLVNAQIPTCPRDALQLGLCANLLGGLVGVVVGNPPTLPCCSLLAGLVDLEAAVCLCQAIKANVLGINVNTEVDLGLLLNACGRTQPRGFKC